MRKRRPEDFQDIYQAPNNTGREEDYNWKIPPELTAHIRRLHIQFVFFALLFIGLVVGLVALLTREIHIAAPEAPAVVRSPDSSFVPHYKLPMDEEWVLMYEASIQQAEPDDDTDRPVSSKWVKNSAYHVIMGHQALQQEQYKESAAHFEKALRIFPTIRNVHEPLGIAYLRQQKFDAAATSLQAAVEENETVSAINNLGVALMGAKRFGEAEPYLLGAQKRQPDQPECYKNLALLYQKTEQPEKALRYFEKYTSLCPADFVTTERYVEYLVDQGQAKEAAAFLIEACRRNVKNPLPLYLLLAKVEAGVANDVGAVEALKNIRQYMSPNLALNQMNSNLFDPVRNTESFQALLRQTELDAVTMEYRR